MKTCKICNRDQWCGVCKRCLYCHCECWKCRACGMSQSRKRVEGNGICHTEGVCKKCCECRNAPSFIPDSKLGIIETSRLGGKSLITRMPRSVGVELEIGDWKNLGRVPIPGLKHHNTRDWSVKPSETEMVISPLRGDALVRGMLELSKAGTAAGSVVNETCALHVHVGGKDLSYWDIRRLLTVYRAIEPEVYSHLIAPHRRKFPSIHYCQMLTVPHVSQGCERCTRYDSQYPGQRTALESLGTTLSRMWMAHSTEDLKICLLRMLYGIENPSHVPTLISTRKGGHFEFCRYVGLNLHSWMHRLTVEFRMKEATFDPMELVMWPLWCGSVVHAVTRMSDAEARSDKMSVRYLTDKWLPGYLREYITRRGL